MPTAIEGLPVYRPPETTTAEEVYGVDIDPGDVYRHDETIVAIVEAGAAPFRADTDIWDHFMRARSEADIRGAFTCVMHRRLGLPTWFAASMSLQEMARTWASALSSMCDPSGEDVVFSGEPERVFHLEACLCTRARRWPAMTPQQIWGDGPITTRAYMEVLLLENEVVAGQAQPNVWSLHLGYIGGRQHGIQPAPADPYLLLEQRVLAMVPAEPPRLMQAAAQRRLAEGGRWDLTLNGAR